MIAIEPESRDRQRPYANLLPILDVLIEAGNRVVGTGFQLTQGGWECVLTEPIDFGFLRTVVDLPSTITGSEEHDQILDRLSWCAITGGAEMARIQARIDATDHVTSRDAE